MSEHGHTNYKKIYWILMVMFIISVIGPEVTENKALILISAFGIAAVKAIIVAGYFMHLATEKKFIWYGFITSLALLFLFVIAVAPDIMKKEGHNWKSNIVVEATETAHGSNHESHEQHEASPHSH